MNQTEIKTLINDYHDTQAIYLRQIFTKPEALKLALEINDIRRDTILNELKPSTSRVLKSKARESIKGTLEQLEEYIIDMMSMAKYSVIKESEADIYKSNLAKLFALILQDVDSIQFVDD